MTLTRKELREQYHDYYIIEHCHNQGGMPTDRWMWMMTINGEVEDWNSPANLIKMAQDDGRKWIQISKHRDGTVSILLSSDGSTKNLNKPTHNNMDVK